MGEIYLMNQLRMIKIYYKINKIAASQFDDYTIGYLLDYSNIKKYYKLIAIGLNKQEKLDAHPKVIW